MDPHIWGPGAWLFLHTITLNYPNDPTERDKENTRELFHNIGKNLPCFYCRDNYIRHLKEYPIQLDSKTELVNWLIDIHNDVNREIGKPILSRNEAIEKILCLYRKQPQNPEILYYCYMFFLFLMIFLIHYF
jgi:FAD-linked sulfhydryl oxidase